jgi:hypothetical protein
MGRAHGENVYKAQNMTALIYTDASYFPDHKFGSFAFWIECEGRIVKMSGILETASNSLEAAKNSMEPIKAGKTKKRSYHTHT